MKIDQQAEFVALGRGWLPKIPEPMREQVLHCAILREYRDGQPIYYIGDEPNGIFGVVSGSLSLSIAPSGRGPYLASIAYPGEWVGCASVLHEKPRSQSAAARTSTKLLYLSRQSINAIAERDPRFWRYLAMNVVSERDQMQRSFDDSLITIPGIRLAATLLRLAGYAPDTAPRTTALEVRVTQNELAQTTGLSRNTVNRVIGNLAAAGLLKIAYGKIELSNRSGLVSISEAVAE